MMEYSVLLEARDPARNIHRAYGISAGQDLFGEWIVAITYGRIGARGHSKTVAVEDKAAAARYVERCIKRRETAPRRIGVGYTVRSTVGGLS